MSEIKWEDYEKLAAKLAWQRAKGNPLLDFDDLMGCAHKAFMTALAKWDPDKGKFSTLFVWWCKDKMNKAHRNLNHLPLEEAANKENGGDPSASLCFRQAVGSLGREAQAVVNMVLNCPDELVNFTYKTVVQPTQQSILAYFRACGWSRDKVERAFGEIKNMLEDL